jgi:hypothetical protein
MHVQRRIGGLAGGERCLYTHAQMGSTMYCTVLAYVCLSPRLQKVHATELASVLVLPWTRGYEQGTVDYGNAFALTLDNNSSRE